MLEGVLCKDNSGGTLRAASEVMLRSLRMIENMSGLEGDAGGGRGGL